MQLDSSGNPAASGISLAVGGFAVISRRTSRRWTHVRGGSSNEESAVNPTAARRPEEFRYHPNRTKGGGTSLRATPTAFLFRLPGGWVLG